MTVGILYLCAVCDEAEAEEYECCKVQVRFKISSLTDLVLTNVFFAQYEHLCIEPELSG